ncbi:unnamed protein product [Polarella glacialis]|uniref:Uncharacterized protein n=1 Tax=Polarella glacialis TaxID=89957 RepID=A0A813JJK4_POLGL|nr:unnamed protein product [Polarella glacialis]
MLFSGDWLSFRLASHDTGCVDEKNIFAMPASNYFMYCEILKQFAVCPWWASCVMCSFKQEGRGSTASQGTDGELAPIHAAGKVPVPCGRECQRETARPQPWFRR